MASFLLIHGAVHGGWCWDRLTPLLEAEGHRVSAPDLPGMGDDPTPIETVTLAGWADFVAAIARDLPAPVILVGHSRGGIVISQAAEAAPDAIDQLVYLAAMLVPDGATMFDMAARTTAEQTPVIMAEDGKSLRLDREVARSSFYNLTPAEEAERALDRLCPEPLAPGATPLALTEARFGRTPRAYIGCAQDRTVINRDLQRIMLAETPCDPVIVIEADHSPFYSAPRTLAANLLEIAARHERPA